LSRILKPFGKVMQRITIEADDKGTIQVSAKILHQEATQGGHYRTVEVPMDSRVMVLALLKVAMDYCAVLFQSIGGNDIGQETASHDNQNVQ
jgi:hypothetical protein